MRPRKAELVGARMLSGSVRSLRFHLADGRALGHVAGQHVDLLVPTSRGLPFRRSYSIASAPDAAHPARFEIAVTRVDRGPTSEALHALRPGELVEVEGPRGTFVRSAEERERPALFVAAGTGLAPIRAMLSEDVCAAAGPPLVLLFGCRTPQDRLWADELCDWERTCPRFFLHVTLSRAPDEWTGLAGYVQRHACALARSLPGVQVYVCGLGAMVDEVATLLARDAGISREALRYEIYD